MNLNDSADDSVELIYERKPTYHFINGLQQVGYEYDIKEDAYGAAVIAIVWDIPFSQHTEVKLLSYMRSSFSFVLLFMNLFLQFALLFYIDKYVVQESLHHVQSQFRWFRQEVFDSDGVFQEDLWEHYENKGEICNIALTNPYFYYVIIFLWLLSMGTEFRECSRLIMYIYCLPHCNSFDDMIKAGDVVSIVSLTRYARYTLWVVVCIPKLVICWCLCFMGLRWLTSTTSHEELIMNVVAMQFVIDVDEIIYSSWVPECYRSMVRGVKFWFHDKEQSDADLQHKELHDWFQAYGQVFLTFIFVPIYGKFIQDVLPSGVDDVIHHCNRYMSERGPLCKGNIWTLQEFRLTPAFEECFPYGK